MNLFDANPETAIPDTAGYPVVIPMMASSPTVPERPGLWCHPLPETDEESTPRCGRIDYMPPTFPEHDPNDRLAAWYVLTIALVLVALAVGLLIGAWKGGVQ